MKHFGQIGVPPIHHPCSAKASAALRKAFGSAMLRFLAETVPISRQNLHNNWNLHWPPPGDPTNFMTYGMSSSAVALLAFIIQQPINPVSGRLWNRVVVPFRLDPFAVLAD